VAKKPREITNEEKERQKNIISTQAIRVLENG
jgi:hypothetical protein